MCLAARLFYNIYYQGMKSPLIMINGKLSFFPHCFKFLSLNFSGPWGWVACPWVLFGCCHGFFLEFFTMLLSFIKSFICHKLHVVFGVVDIIYDVC